MEFTTYDTRMFKIMKGNRFIEQKKVFHSSIYIPFLKLPWIM